MKPGPQTPCNDELIASFAKILPSVLHLDTVSHYLGIHPRTARQWLAEGRREEKRRARGKEPSNDPATIQYYKFHRAHVKAIASGEIGAVATVRKAAEHHWGAAAWLLERRFGERWGPDRKLIRDLERQIAHLESLLNP